MRLEFIMEPDGSLDLDRYDMVVNSICLSGMDVIGLVTMPMATVTGGPALLPGILLIGNYQIYIILT